MGATTTHVLYHGSAIHAEYDPTWTAPTRQVVHGPGADHPLLTLTGTGPSATVQAYHQDGLGSVVALTYSSGGTDARARYYDPALGRFRSPDPLVPAPGDPQSLNRYSYVRNNPLTFIDPSGRAFTPFHMLADFPGATLGWLLSFGSAPNPLTVAWSHVTMDQDPNDLSKSGLGQHANAWKIAPAAPGVPAIFATRTEALAEAWGLFKGSLGERKTQRASHTFYDILNHWGQEWRG